MGSFDDILAAAVPGLPEGSLAQVRGVAVSGVSADSRTVQPGMVFVAINGVTGNGADHIPDALEKGASVILVQSQVEVAASVPVSVPVVRVPDTRRALTALAAAFHPRQPATVVAVTGTAGKTSVATFLRQIWQASGLRAAQIGTTGVISDVWSDCAGLTTPGPVFLYNALDRLAAAGVSHVAIEASSHGLDQHRLDAVRLSAVGFTNLGRDHMDYHPDLDHYMNAKMRLIETLAPKGVPAVVDPEAPWADVAARRAQAAGLDLRSVGPAGNDITLCDVVQRDAGQLLTLSISGVRHQVLLPLAGRFQISNALIAGSLAQSTGVSVAEMLVGLSQLKGAPGRMEHVGRTATGAAAYVDYAHKPDSLRAVLDCLRDATTGRLVVVFGCGGNRDAGKRAHMGRVAAEGADRVFVTDDNPRFEDPSAIRAEVLAGASEATSVAVVTEIADRTTAIRTAMAELRAGDTLLVAGKGHETGQIVAGRSIPHSDGEVILAGIHAQLGKGAAAQG